MWEWYSERLKIRAGLTIVGLIFVSMIMSCNEMRYTIWGKTVEATLIETKVEKSRSRGSEMIKRVASYGFTDGENYRREYADVDMDWEGQNLPTVKIQYIPAKIRASRIVNQTHNGIWVFLFYSTVVAGVAWVAVTWAKSKA